MTLKLIHTEKIDAVEWRSPEEGKAAMSSLEKGIITYQVSREGELLALGGAVIDTQYTASLWLVTSVMADKYPVMAMKGICDAVDMIVEDMRKRGVCRLQSICKYGDTRAFRINKMVGLEPDCVMKSYNGPGRDVWLMGMVI